MSFRAACTLAEFAIGFRTRGAWPPLATSAIRPLAQGDESFRERLPRLLETTVDATDLRLRKDAAVEHGHALAEAQRILETGLRAFSLRAADLSAPPKGDLCKLAIAAAIRQRTAVPNAWIAAHLHLGHVSRVSHGVRRAQGGEHAQALARGLAHTVKFET